MPSIKKHTNFFENQAFLKNFFAHKSRAEPEWFPPRALNLLFDPLDRALFQPRDLRLADADLLRDLHLRLSVIKPQAENMPLALAQLGDRLGQRAGERQSGNSRGGVRICLIMRDEPRQHAEREAREGK